MCEQVIAVVAFGQEYQMSTALDSNIFVLTARIEPQPVPYLMFAMRMHQRSID